MGKNTVSVNSLGLTAPIMKENTKMIKRKAMENFSIKRADS